MAARRRGPTFALDGLVLLTSTDVMGAINTEIVAIWNKVGGVLQNVGGTGNVITATATDTLAAYSDGLEFSFVAAAANIAGGTTINVDGVGAATVRDYGGTALAANAFVAAKAYSIRYFSADPGFRIVSGSGGQAAYESKQFLAALTQAANTAGGATTSGSWQTYPLATTIRNDFDGEGASLSANTILALPAGTYDCFAAATFFSSGVATLRLFNVTDAAEIVLGKAPPNTGVSGPGVASLSGRFVLSAPKTIRLDYRCTASKATNGLGAVMNIGETERYGYLEINRVPGVVDPGAGWGRATRWIPAGDLIPATTNGPASGSVETTTNKVMLKTLDFDATTQEIAQYHWVPPKRWDRGTIAVRFRWKHAATATNFGVAWDCAGVAFSDDDAADTAFGTAIQVTDTGGTTNDIYITAETAAVTIAGSPAEADSVWLRFRRVPADGADTLAIDAGLLGVELYYNINANTDA